MLSVILFLSCKGEDKKQSDMSDVSVITNVKAEDIKLDIYDFNGLEK